MYNCGGFFLFFLKNEASDIAISLPSILFWGFKSIILEDLPSLLLVILGKKGNKSGLLV